MDIEFWGGHIAMKVYAILRGFPGLGRVVGGLALLQNFKSMGANVYVATYGQGCQIVQDSGMYVFSSKAIMYQDISSIGIIPVSRFGERIIQDIEQKQPDVIICDGEPLMVEALALQGWQNKLVALLNPFDIDNPYNIPSSQKYFSNLYHQAGLLIVHGLFSDEFRLYKNKREVYLHTIIRTGVNFFEENAIYDNIVGILGGGTTHCSDSFRMSSCQIAHRIGQIACQFSNQNVKILCNDLDIASTLKKDKELNNVTIVSNYVEPRIFYSQAKLVIARAGRNTISELLYLGIPSIVISASRGDFRNAEQEANIRAAEELSDGWIVGASVDTAVEELVRLFSAQLQRLRRKSKWKPGNQLAIKSILSFVGE